MTAEQIVERAAPVRASSRRRSSRSRRRRPRRDDGRARVPSSVFISSETFRVLRDNPPYMTVLGTPDGSTHHVGPKPYAGLRSTSGRASASIFTTSAPSSARMSPVVFPAMNDAEGEDAELVDGASGLPVRVGRLPALGELGGRRALCSPRHGAARPTENSSGVDRNGAPGMRTSRPSAPRQGHEVVPRRELLVLDELARGCSGSSTAGRPPGRARRARPGCGRRGAC